MINMIRIIFSVALLYTNFLWSGEFSPENAWQKLMENVTQADSENNTKERRAKIEEFFKNLIVHFAKHTDYSGLYNFLDGKSTYYLEKMARWYSLNRDSISATLINNVFVNSSSTLLNFRLRELAQEKIASLVIGHNFKVIFDPLLQEACAHYYYLPTAFKKSNKLFEIDFLNQLVETIEIDKIEISLLKDKGMRKVLRVLKDELENNVTAIANRTAVYEILLRLGVLFPPSEIKTQKNIVVSYSPPKKGGEVASKPAIVIYNNDPFTSSSPPHQSNLYSYKKGNCLNDGKNPIGYVAYIPYGKVENIIIEVYGGNNKKGLDGKIKDSLIANEFDKIMLAKKTSIIKLNLKDLLNNENAQLELSESFINELHNSIRYFLNCLKKPESISHHMASLSGAKIFLMGSSFGGFMALYHAIYYDSDTLAGYISHAGGFSADLRKNFDYVDRCRILNTPEKICRVNSPFFLHHNSDDNRVPSSEAIRLYKAFKRANKEHLVRLVISSGGAQTTYGDKEDLHGHYLPEGKPLTKLCDQIIDFMRHPHNTETAISEYRYQKWKRFLPVFHGLGNYLHKDIKREVEDSFVGYLLWKLDVRKDSPHFQEINRLRREFTRTGSEDQFEILWEKYLVNIWAQFAFEELNTNPKFLHKKLINIELCQSLLESDYFIMWFKDNKELIANKLIKHFIWKPNFPDPRFLSVFQTNYKSFAYSVLDGFINAEASAFKELAPHIVAICLKLAVRDVNVNEPNFNYQDLQFLNVVLDKNSSKISIKKAFIAIHNSRLRLMKEKFCRNIAQLPNLAQQQ